MGCCFMSAKANDDRRVQELYSIIQETQARIDHFGLTKDSFLSDDSLTGRSYADILLMCVFRATEEAGRMSDEVRIAYPNISWRGILGMRNILAHDYGKVDRAIIWTSVVEEFPLLEAFCHSYADDHGISLGDEDERVGGRRL